MTALAVPLGFTRERLVACAERELRMRQRVYPGWVARWKMQDNVALDEMQAMAAIVEVLRQLPGPAPVPPAQGALSFGDGGRKA